MNHDDKNVVDPGDSNWTTRIDDVFEDLELAERKAREHQEKTDRPIEPFTPWVVEFRVMGTPEIIRAPLGQRLLVGRDDTSKDIYPEIDLTPYNAQGLGVSRRHARLLMRDNRLTVEDLGSANGTYVNGMRIASLAPTRLRDGDHLKLGNLSLQVHFVVQPRSDTDTLHGFEDDLDIPKIGSGQRLLVLDDNKEVCAVIRMIALYAGFKVAISHDIQTAISFLDEGDIHGIIMELMLEDNNGLDVVDYVRQQYPERITIIATTSSAGGYREGQALAKGVDTIFEKPLSVDTIMEALGKFTG